MTTINGPLGSGAPAFPKRFYTSVATVPEHGGFALTLDGKPARTPSRQSVVVPTAALAAALAAEWDAVETVIDPRAMPLTRLVNSVIDGVSRSAAAVEEELLRYAESDLIAYRAPDPAELVALQQSHWDPIVDWAAARFGVGLSLASGVMFVAQPPASLARLRAALVAVRGEGPAAPFRLGALHVLTTLTGSALLALAVACERMKADEAWASAHVDEDFQIARWGTDDEAAQRRHARWEEMRVATQMLTLVRSNSP